jgi:Subtilase family
MRTLFLATGFAFAAVSTWVAPASATEAPKAQLAGLGASLRPASDVALASGELRATVERLRAGRPAPAGVADLVDDRTVRVEVLHRLSAPALQDLLARLGAVGLRRIDANTAEALVPYERLEALEAADGVTFVRPPLVSNVAQSTDGPPTFSVMKELAASAGAVTGFHVTKTNATNWHSRGLVGNGIKVGIIDSFAGADWLRAAASGEVPANVAGAFCIENGVGCGSTFWTRVPAGSSSGVHGVGVAETILDMAPGATLYLAQLGPRSAADLQAAVDWFAANGVRIVSRSLTGVLDGPGNGTGPSANVVNNAVARGMVWFNSAGNHGGGNGRAGNYWRATWTDTNNDTWMDFDGPGNVMMEIPVCSTFFSGFRWSDWGASRTDYDIYVYDTTSDFPNGWEARSIDDQSAGALPLEHITTNTCDSSGDRDYLAIQRYPTSTGQAGDVLEWMMNGGGLEYWSNPYSQNQPIADTNSPGALSVGAVDPAAGVTAAVYSSQGPSNDNRTKPDISAASCFSTVATTPNCFNGTSAATPVVAGAAALYMGSAAVTPAQVKSYLTGTAFVDRGSPGPDNVYGVGELYLPSLAPPPAPPPPPPAPPPPPIRNPLGADRVRPTVRALVATGVRGGTVRLRYRVFDNSRVTRELVTVYRGRTQRVKRIATRYAQTGPRGKVYFVRWKAPRRARAGSWRFCVQAFDRTGNKSRVSCARIKLRR